MEHLDDLPLSGPALVMGDRSGLVEDALSRVGVKAGSWNRRAYGGKTASAWPSGGPYRFVALRLPPAKEELQMSVHAGLSVLRRAGVLVVYGAKDEGIGSADRVMEELLPDVETVATGNRCRVLMARRPDEILGLRGSLIDWQVPLEYGLPYAPGPWISFPGVFSHGRLDPGTRLLLDHLPKIPPHGRILDYGCGTGIIGAVAGSRGEDIQIELLDVDAVALQAARKNVPGARTFLLDGLPDDRPRRYDAIISNPPFHRGKAEDPSLLQSLLEGAPALLNPRGVLCLVAQRRFPVKETLEEGFREVDRLAEDSIYRIWRGRNPKS